jgi:riboflavin kinase/FMN adenylyltransferase
MQIISWGELLENGFRASGTAGLAITTGVFDGVHRGHRELLKRVCAQPALPPADSGFTDGFTGIGFPRIESAAVTFRQNPRRVLFPQKTTQDITTLDEKLALLEGAGLNYCILIDFTPEFAAMTGEEFIGVLLEKAGMRYMAVGQDFHCGSNRMNAARIKQFVETGGASRIPYGGRRVEIIPPVMDGGLPVSSSRIRAALAAGDCALAERLLGHGL